MNLADLPCDESAVATARVELVDCCATCGAEFRCGDVPAIDSPRYGRLCGLCVEDLQ